VASFKQSGVVVTKLTYIPQPHLTGASYTTCSTLCTQTVNANAQKASTGIYKCIRHIVKHEGPKGLFKGLGPNLIGVAPSRAIYFCAYATSKEFWNSAITPETPLVHILSAFSAGFMASTCTNPIWFIKTRLQLDQKRSGGLTATKCIRHIYQNHGIRGFYKGITASYVGISETVIHFVIYEAIKARLQEMKGACLDETNRSIFDFLEFMGAGATSKTIASCIAYPHEVVRTRLRQEGQKYNRFWQTLILVAREEGYRALYRGLATQLVRQIPNTAIMMSTYEAVVYTCSKRR